MILYQLIFLYIYNIWCRTRDLFTHWRHKFYPDSGFYGPAQILMRSVPGELGVVFTTLHICAILFIPLTPNCSRLTFMFWFNLNRLLVFSWHFNSFAVNSSIHLNFASPAIIISEFSYLNFRLLLDLNFI